MGHNYHSLSIDAIIMVSKQCPITGEHVGIIFVTQQVTIATLWPTKSTLNFSFKRLYFKNGTAKFFCYYRILISRVRCNFWQSLKKFCTWVSEPPQIFENSSQNRTLVPLRGSSQIFRRAGLVLFIRESLTPVTWFFLIVTQHKSISHRLPENAGQRRNSSKY